MVTQKIQSENASAALDPMAWPDGPADKDRVQVFQSQPFHAVPIKSLQILVLSKGEWNVFMKLPFSS